MRRSSGLAVWLFALAVCAVIAGRSSYRTDMGDFLPHSGALAQQVLAGQVNGGAASHILLVAISGAPPASLATASETLAAALRGTPNFLAVLNGDDASFTDVQTYLWANRYRLSPRVTPAAFSAAGLHGALTNDVALLGSTLGPMLGQSVPADPTGEGLYLLRPFTSGPAPARADGVWVTANGSAAVLLVQTAAPGFDIDAQQEDLRIIRSDFLAAQAGGGKLAITGPGLFAVSTRDITQQDVSRLSTFALLGAAGLLAFAYRSPTVLLLGLLPIVSGALAAVAAVSLAFGFVHGITLGFGVTLIGESLDYAIYLFTQTGRGEPASATLARIWPTLRLGALTSMAGFCAMLGSNFTGFAQLGLFSIAGLAAAAATTRFVLPKLMPSNFFAPGAAPLSRPLDILTHHRIAARGVVALGVLAAVLALFTHRGGMWDSNLLDLSPIPPATQQLDTSLRHALGLADQRYFAVFTAPDEQQALQESEALASVLAAQVEAGALGGYDLPSTMLPSDHSQRARQAALPDDATLHANFAAGAAGLPLNIEAFAPFFADVAAARHAPLLTAAALPPTLALQFNSMLVRHGAGWVAMIPLRAVADPARLARALAGQPGLSVVDLDQESGRLLALFQRQAVTLALAGSIAILLILWGGLRSPRRAAAVALPLAASVLMTAALLTAGGAKLSIFMVAGFLLIIAIGSNYCLFFERSAPGSPEWPRAAASIVLANLCTVAAYGLLSLSRIPVLHDIGATVATGTFLCLLCGAVLSTAARR